MWPSFIDYYIKKEEKLDGSTRLINFINPNIENNQTKNRKRGIFAKWNIK